MRLLYLNYGPQSGVTAAVARHLGQARVDVTCVDVLEGFGYALRPGSRIPNLRPAVVRAVAEAVRTHGALWKRYYVHTTFAFDLLSRVAGAAIRGHRPDAILQAGVLFSPGLRAERPYHLYVDHTRALSERYAPLAGLPAPLPPAPAWRAREQAVYRGAAGIFAMSEGVKASLAADYGVDPARVHVVGAGPNVAPRARGPALRSERAILFVGRDFAAKGGPELLDAFAEARRAHPDARLWIVTDAAPRTLPEGATSRGPLGVDALARLYARAGVFALPTLREAFGLALLEAMAFGLPVVATRIEAIPEIVLHGETGLLVPPRDPRALAGALSTLLSDPRRARRMGAAGRARVLARFGWDRAVAGMLTVLRPPPRRDAAPATFAPAR